MHKQSTIVTGRNSPAAKNPLMAKNTIEQQALQYGAVINLAMAVAGWLAYYLSGSQALFLDGNFSFLMFVSLFVAIRISAIKEKRTELFPYGQFVYEALYSLLKGLMITGVLLVSFVQNAATILHFIYGGEAEVLKTGVILIYAVTMVILCFGSALYYRMQYAKTETSSTILRAEYSAAIVDGFMSAGIGVALVSIRFVDQEGAFGFLHYIGDSLLVLLLCVLLGKGPLLLIRDSFIEIAGGTLQNKKNRQLIEGVLQKYLSQVEVQQKSYISKTGSSYLVVAYLNTQSVTAAGSEKIEKLRQQTQTELQKNLPNVMFEIVLSS